MWSGVGVGGAGWDLTQGAQGGPAGNGPRPGDWEQPERVAAPGCGRAMLGPGAARAALPGTSSGCIPSAARRPFSSCARGGPVLPTCARRSGNLPMSPLFWLRPAALPLQAGPTCSVLGLGVRVSLSVLQDTLQKRRPVGGRGVTLLPVSLLWLPWTSPRNHYPRFCPPLLATEPPPTCPPSLCPWSIWHQTPAPTQSLSLTLPAAETPPHTHTPPPDSALLPEPHESQVPDSAGGMQLWGSPQRFQPAQSLHRQLTNQRGGYGAGSAADH